MIFTFYSYKGGVGRSMALANIAELLYEKGASVLMIDWDLDSPGLDIYFPHIHEEAIETPGLINMILHYKNIVSNKDPEKTGFELTEKSFLTLEREKDLPKEILSEIKKLQNIKYTNEQEIINDLEKLTEEHKTEQYKKLILKHALHLNFGDMRNFILDVHFQQDENGSKFLKLLSAGMRSGTYFKQYINWVNSFDWKDFYENWAGEQYFEWFRREIENIADIILIDSRSGVNEMNGVCTKQLADVVVAFTSSNRQSTEGTKKMVEDLLEFANIEKLRPDRSKLNVVVVPARVELTELIARNNFEKKFKDNFDDLLPENWKKEGRSFWELRIPYIPLYAFEELVAVREEKGRVSQELVEAYNKIWEAMVVKASPPGEEPWRWRQQTDKILIVENISSWQELLKHIVVSKTGEEYELATTKESALSMLKENEYKLIILNLDLSSDSADSVVGYEGVDILDYLKATGRKISVLLITSGAVIISTRNIFDNYPNVNDLLFKSSGKTLAKDLAARIQNILSIH